MMLDYPDELLRGISNNDFIDEEGRASALLFQFDDADRQDGYMEASINWFDDEYSLKLMLAQRKQNDDTTYQFKIGVAILSRDRLDLIVKSPNAKNAISYERQKLYMNPYHGNILLKSGLTKQIRLMLAGSVAMCVDRILYRED